MWFLMFLIMGMEWDSGGILVGGLDHFLFFHSIWE
jgi:hypothetical protein